jgi:hypothetical protein
MITPTLDGATHKSGDDPGDREIAAGVVIR